MTRNSTLYEVQNVPMEIWQRTIGSSRYILSFVQKLPIVRSNTFSRSSRYVLWRVLLLVIPLQKGGHPEGGEGTNHNPDEEQLVSHRFLQPSGGHARNHHAERHESGADGIVGGLVFVVGKADEVKHVGRKAKAVAELLDEYAEVDDEQGFGLCITEVDIHRIGDGDGAYHRPYPALQPLSGYGDASKDAS